MLVSTTGWDMWADGCTPNQVDFTDEADAVWHCFCGKKRAGSSYLSGKQKQTSCKNERGNKKERVISKEGKSEADNREIKMLLIQFEETSACL